MGGGLIRSRKTPPPHHCRSVPWTMTCDREREREIKHDAGVVWLQAFCLESGHNSRTQSMHKWRHRLQTSNNRAAVQQLCLGKSFTGTTARLAGMTVPHLQEDTCPRISQSLASNFSSSVPAQSGTRTKTARLPRQDRGGK